MKTRRLTTLLLALPLVAAPALATPTAPHAPAPGPLLPLPDRVDDLIEQGRAKLLERDAEGALALFRQAAELDGGLRTKVWLLRTGMESGALNDLLAEIDALDREHDGPEIDYLYGMAFAIKAQAAIDAGLTDGTIGMQMTDAQTYLTAALEADGSRFSDGWPVLSRVAWMNQDLDGAIAASDRAVGHYPEGAAVLVQRGRIQLSRYIAIAGDEEQAEARAEIAADGVAALEKGIRLMGRATDDGRVTERADAYKQLAYLHQYAGDLDAAVAAYGEGMAWDPSQYDFGQLWGSLGERFIPTLTAGKQAYAKRWGADSPFDAQLLWYLGYARLSQRDADNYELGEEELLASVRKFPAYGNAWYYVCQLRSLRFDYLGAADAMLTYWEQDRASAVGTVSADLATAREYLDFIVGQCVNEGQLLKAADLSELLANADPDGHLDWSYRALFLRDHADIMLRTSPDVEWGDEALMAFYESSLAAYERALAEDPGNPNYMNDLAVVLHYNLRRDFERALELYDGANENAKRMMEDPDVPQSRKDNFISIALRDSGNNARLLRRQLEKWEEDRKEREGEAREKKKEREGQGS